MKQLLIFLMLVSYASANDVVYLPKDKPAPFAGYLLDPPTATKATQNKIDLDASQAKIQLYKEDAKIYEDRLNNYKNHNESLSKQLAETKESGFFSKIGFFVLGSLLTGGIAYGVYRTR